VAFGWEELNGPDSLRILVPPSLARSWRTPVSRTRRRPTPSLKGSHDPSLHLTAGHSPTAHGGSSIFIPTVTLGPWGRTDASAGLKPLISRGGPGIGSRAHNAFQNLSVGVAVQDHTSETNCSLTWNKIIVQWHSDADSNEADPGGSSHKCRMQIDNKKED
jgi:hypothetical protein